TRRGQVGRNGRAGAGARAAWVAVEHVRILRLAAAAAPPARGVRGPEVRPLAQVRLPEDDRARLTKPSGNKRVARRDRLTKRERPGARAHAVGGVDVVLDQHGNAVQWSAHPSTL